MDDEKKRVIGEIVPLLRKLDLYSLALVKSSADALAARGEIEKVNEKKVMNQLRCRNGKGETDAEDKVM